MRLAAIRKQPFTFLLWSLDFFRMAYQVIARKWRPKDFNELIGQEHISQTLLNALRNKRLHHALLFTGPRGTGKTSSARILAKSVRCPNAIDFIPCHKCSDCEDISSGRSLNVIEIDGASNNGVDAIRELRDTVGYLPSSGEFKLYIIDEVHMLSTSAFNALLKTLEEPPAHVLFVMATTEAHKIPDTVLSRVQRFDFRCIPTRTIVQHLKMICDSEAVAADVEALWMIARQGAGSMRDSQSFLDQAITFSGRNLTLKNVTAVLGLTDRSLLTAMLSALVQQSPQAAAQIQQQVFESGYEARLFLQDLLESIRHLLMVKILNGKPGEVVDLPESEIESFHQLSQSLSEEQIHLLFDMGIKGAQDLQRAPSTQVAMEMTLLRMCSAFRWFKLGQSTTRSMPIEPPRTPVSSPTPQAAHSPITSTSPSSHPKTNEDWFQLVKRVQMVNATLGAQLENCSLIENKGAVLVLGIAPKMKFLAEKFNAPEFKRKILNYITTFWGSGFSIEVKAIQDESISQQTPKALEHQRLETEKLEIQRRVEEHPLLKTTQSLFKTEIKSIKENKS